uniref:Uncharacterized protein n=1 Tax=Sphaerodactylus townsendi TaxID=933632 RepID=A0ACB8FA68_9SAUR
MGTSSRPLTHIRQRVTSPQKGRGELWKRVPLTYGAPPDTPAMLLKTPSAAQPPTPIATSSGAREGATVVGSDVGACSTANRSLNSVLSGAEVFWYWNDHVSTLAAVIPVLVPSLCAQRPFCTTFVFSNVFSRCPWKSFGILGSQYIQ